MGHLGSRYIYIYIEFHSLIFLFNLFAISIKFYILICSIYFMYIYIYIHYLNILRVLALSHEHASKLCPFSAGVPQKTFTSIRGTDTSNTTSDLYDFWLEH